MLRRLVLSVLFGVLCIALSQSERFAINNMAWNDTNSIGKSESDISLLMNLAADLGSNLAAIKNFSTLKAKTDARIEGFNWEVNKANKEAINHLERMIGRSEPNAAPDMSETYKTNLSDPRKFEGEEDYLQTQRLIESMNLTQEQISYLLKFNIRGIQCTIKFWSTPYPSEGLYCNATWDSFYCWPTTLAGTIVYKPCPVSQFSHKDAKAFRVCEKDGTWAKNEWTNYSACLGCLDPQSPFYGTCNTETHSDDQHEYINRITRDITFYGSIISLIFLSSALFIFIYFKSLKCMRISIHKNLVLAFILRSLMTIAIAEPAVMGRVTSYRQIEWLCKLVISLNIYGTLASVAWMFNEGLYLYSRIVTSVFTSENMSFWIFHFLGWGLPILFMTVWAIFINKSHPDDCWRNYSSSPYIWIIGVPMVMALSVNLFFLIHIIRTLVLKLRASNFVESTNIKKTVKATIILFPLLGITNLLFFFNPKDQSILENMYLLINAFLQNSQGIFVSVLYCFLNGEVRHTICKKYKNYRLSHVITSSSSQQRKGGRRKTTNSLFANSASSWQQLFNSRTNVLKSHYSTGTMLGAWDGHDKPNGAIGDKTINLSNNLSKERKGSRKLVHKISMKLFPPTPTNMTSLSMITETSPFSNRKTESTLETSLPNVSTGLEKPKTPPFPKNQCQRTRSYKYKPLPYFSQKKRSNISIASANGFLKSNGDTRSRNTNKNNNFFNFGTKSVGAAVVSKGSEITGPNSNESGIQILTHSLSSTTSLKEIETHEKSPSTISSPGQCHRKKGYIECDINFDNYQNEGHGNNGNLLVPIRTNSVKYERLSLGEPQIFFQVGDES